MTNNKFCSFLAVMTASAMVTETDAEQQMKKNKRNQSSYQEIEQCVASVFNKQGRIEDIKYVSTPEL